MATAAGRKPSRKRVTVKPPECPVKALFIQWLGEWQDEAKQKESKVQFVYGKAKRAMAKYPLPLNSGDEASVIQCCGPKICGQLEEKLQEYIREFGDPRPSSRVVNPLANLNGPGDKRVKSKTAGPVLDPTMAGFTPEETKTESKTMGGKKQNTSPTRKRERTYIPTYRSGPYAILVALYNHHMNPNAVRPFLRKDELIELAQPLCDTSFTKPPAGSEYYTAWSSMSHLLTKGLVQKSSSPPQFRLSPEGVNLAILLTSADGPGPSTRSPAKSQSATKRMKPEIPGEAAHEMVSCELRNNSQYKRAIVSQDIASSSHQPLPPVATAEDQIEFVYLDSAGLSHMSKSQAHVEISAEIAGDIGFMIRLREIDVQKLPNTDYLRVPGGKEKAGFVSVYLSDRLCPEIAPGFTQITPSSTDPPQLTRAPTSSTGELFSTLQSTGPSTISRSSTFLLDQPSTSKDAYTTPSQYGYHLPPMRQYSSINGSAKEVPASVHNAAKDAAFCLTPGSFDVVLCVDLGETAGQHPAKKQLEATLRRNNVPFEQRRLKVGDFIWIARRRSGSGPSVAPRCDPQGELVLDHVVERKRLDDLISSIMDGRFKEQKHRLQTCGIKRKMYLVEDYKTPGLAPEEDRALSAAVNTQIQCGFTVVNTKDCEDTVAYLTLMTKHLLKATRMKTLFRAKTGEDRSDEYDATAAEWVLPSFVNFQQAGLKQGATTIRHLFTQQLMQFRGMSADRALALTRLYPTPRSFTLALQSISNEKERLKTIATIRPDGSVTSIGPALAKTVIGYYLWNS